MRAADPAVGELTRLCGCLPLAIGMLASQLRHHPAWTAAGLAVELADARDRLAVMRAENLSVAAAFGLSYQDLSEDQQRLFRRLGLIPGPTFDAYAAAALDATSLETARSHLAELYDQHLITEPAPGRHQLHDLLREHARSLAAADDRADGKAATRRLLDYYLHTALAADQHVATWAAAYHRPPTGPRRPSRLTWPLCNRQPPGSKPSGPASMPPLSTPRYAGSPGTPSRFPPQWAASCSLTATGTRPPLYSRPPWT
jgi:hypothetical protein